MAVDVMMDKLKDELEAKKYKFVKTKGTGELFILLRDLLKGPVSGKEYLSRDGNIISNTRTWLTRSGYPYTVRMDKDGVITLGMRNIRGKNISG